MFISINFMPKFEAFRDEKQTDLNEGGEGSPKSLLLHLRHQTVPHTHNVSLYIILGLLTGQLRWFVAFVGAYVTLWYVWTNVRLIAKAMRIDAQERSAAS